MFSLLFPFVLNNYSLISVPPNEGDDDGLWTLSLLLLITIALFFIFLFSYYNFFVLRNFDGGILTPREFWRRMNNWKRNGRIKFKNLRRHIKTRMDIMFETYLNSDGRDFPTCDSPVWIFGRSYSANYDLEELRRSVSSCMWVTYRAGFEKLGGYTTDQGWGCMIRTGQMLLAKALLLRHLGSDWHWSTDSRDPTYLKIVSLVADIPSAPFSLHQIALCGETLGKTAGSWLGPNTVCQALKKIILSGNTSLDLTIHIAMNSILATSEVKRECMGHPSLNPMAPSTIPSSNIVSSPRRDPKWKPLLLVVPLRLGLSDLNRDYFPAIKAVFETPQCIGIIGGRPNHALYIIGYAENEVLYLDPHTVQPVAQVGSKLTDSEVVADETYHSQKPGRMPLTGMDPSLAVCFYCNSEVDFDNLCKKLRQRFAEPKTLPLFEISERSDYDTSYSSYGSNNFLDGGFTSIGGPSASRSKGTYSPNPISSSDIDDDEFEILG